MGIAIGAFGGAVGYIGQQMIDGKDISFAEMFKQAAIGGAFGGIPLGATLVKILPFNLPVNFISGMFQDFLTQGVVDPALEGMYEAWESKKTEYLEYLKNHNGNSMTDVDKKYFQDLYNEYKGSHVIYSTRNRRTLDPIALDLDGDGVEFVKDGAYFDYDGNKFAEKATWLGKDDGWLTRDINGDGIINDGTELFGDSTRKKDGTLAQTPFEALAEYDENQDGVINANDAIYSQLTVWRDANGNGVTDAGELKTLAELGIKQLNLKTVAGSSTQLPNGETLFESGSFVWNNDIVGQMNGYGISRNQLDSRETEILEISEDVRNLPNISGKGNLCSLQQAITRDASGELKRLVTDFVNTTDSRERANLTEEILLKWCGTDAINPASRGGVIDARKLAALEVLFAESWQNSDVQYGGNPYGAQALELNNIFNRITENIYCELLVQTTALQFVVCPAVDGNGKAAGFDLDFAKKMLDGIISSDKAVGLELLGEFWRTAMAYGYANPNTVDFRKYLDFRNEYMLRGEEYQSALAIYGYDNGLANGCALGSDKNDNMSAAMSNTAVFGMSGDDVITSIFDTADIFGGDGNDNILASRGEFGFEVVEVVTAT